VEIFFLALYPDGFWDLRYLKISAGGPLPGCETFGTSS